MWVLVVGVQAWQLAGLGLPLLALAGLALAVWPACLARPCLVLPGPAWPGLARPGPKHMSQARNGRSESYAPLTSDRAGLLDV